MCIRDSLEGFRTALTRVINDYARKQNLLKEKDANLTGDDVREGLSAVISVKLPDPQFEGQTKAKLGSSYMRALTLKIVTDGLAAVSYTHLDVYKRQHLDSGRRRHHPLC